jgi:hypothetical protein
LSSTLSFRISWITVKWNWFFCCFFKVYSKGMLIFNGVGEALKNLRSRFAGSVLNLQGSLKEFSDIEDMLKQESSEFEVSFCTYFVIYLFLGSCTRVYISCNFTRNSYCNDMTWRFP